MATLKMGVGFSHSPEMAVDARLWSELVIPGDMPMGMKYVDGDGTQLTGSELAARDAGKYAAQAQQSHWDASGKIVRDAVDRIKASIQENEIDVIFVFGDDQYELFDHSNHPAMLIYYGEEFRMANLKARLIEGAVKRNLSAETVHQMLTGIHCEERYTYPNHAGLAKHAIASLMRSGFDISTSGQMPADEDRGIGHAFGVVIGQLALESRIPVVPMYINTYFPPNQPSPNRCYDLGLAVRAAIESYPEDINVAVLASGGLTHFVLDEQRVDRPFIDLMYSHDDVPLRTYPHEILQSGNSEMLNWIAVHAACQHLNVQWHAYTPVYRTDWGQGVGVAVMEWS